jgi:hypothetical protein
MSPEEVQRIVDAFNAADVGWYFDHDVAMRAENVAAEAGRVSAEVTNRLGHRVDVLNELLSNPTRLAAFVQTFAMPMTNPIRAMVYLILGGARVVELQYAYSRSSTSDLHVTLETVSHDRLEFGSTELWDAEVLRHFGLAKLGDKPLVDGYFAFKGP